MSIIISRDGVAPCRAEVIVPVTGCAAPPGGGPCGGGGAFLAGSR